MSNPRSYKTDAVILRRSEYGESDYLLTIYSRPFGKLTVIAKGARKHLSRRAGHVELYSHSHLVVHKGRGMDVVSQAEVINPFSQLQSDLDRTLLASHFAELLDQFAFEGESNPRAFDVIVRGYKRLCDLDSDANLVTRYYEFQLLRVMGFEPNLFECVITGETLQATDQFFCSDEGGVVSAQHTAGLDVMLLPLPIFKVLRHFSRSKWSQIKTLKLSPEHHATLKRVLHHYITSILERKLKSVALLDKLTHD